MLWTWKSCPEFKLTTFLYVLASCRSNASWPTSSAASAAKSAQPSSPATNGVCSSHASQPGQSGMSWRTLNGDYSFRIAWFSIYAKGTRYLVWFKSVWNRCIEKTREMGMGENFKIICLCGNKTAKDRGQWGMERRNTVCSWWTRKMKADEQPVKQLSTPRSDGDFHSHNF